MHVCRLRISVCASCARRVTASSPPTLFTRQTSLLPTSPNASGILHIPWAWLAPADHLLISYQPGTSNHTSPHPLSPSSPHQTPSGMWSNLSSQQHRAAPTIFADTPPELLSPSSSTYSSVSSEGHSTCRSRSDGPLSPPMSSCDQHRLYVADDMRRRSPADKQVHEDAMGQRQLPGTASATRPQLPSLSSLFPPGQRTLPSPLSERPSYSASSPMDPPRSAGGYFERPAASSYFSPAGPSGAVQPSRSVFEAKFLDRVAPAPSQSQSQSRPAFPVMPSPGQPEPGPVHRAEPSSRWSFHQDMLRGSESSLGARGHAGAYRAQPVTGQKHSHEGYLGGAGDSSHRTDPRPSSQHFYQPSHHAVYAPPPPSTTTTAAAGETIPTKDGLGPKIWTGAQFLPRFVRAAELPGEGLCYFYDDGSHCKTVIDGEAVNAHWGVTKAGKPRKRLAIACVTCREKKIKCDPDYPRCVQCEKFGRVCKFKNA